MKKFPKGFLFGSATAAHQIEGGNFNSDWHEFEKIPGKIAQNHSSHPAANSWNNWKKDVELLKQTNQNAYRFSIEWAKIEPECGKFNEKVIAQYKQQLRYLHENNIKTMVTLWHFSLPKWFAVIGGFLYPKNISHFVNYCDRMGRELGDLVDLWVTINEPQTYVLTGYIQGIHAPGIKNIWSGLKVIKNLAKTHILSYKKLRLITTRPVGIAENIAIWEPLHINIFSYYFALIINYLATFSFIAPISKHIDFLGINYYFKVKVQIHKPHFNFIAKRKNDSGWSINQEGLYQVIMENLIWRKPIYITENGVADCDDLHRPKFIKDALFYTNKAIEKGADVRGYFHWTLMDNFEWAAGYTSKFGLFTIDRKPRTSAKIYADLIKKYSAE